MPAYELVKVDNVVVAVKASNHAGEFDIRIPDRYLGDGNDIVTEVLHVLFAREYMTRIGRIDYYNAEIAKGASVSGLLVEAIYGCPPNDDGCCNDPNCCCHD